MKLINFIKKHRNEKFLKNIEKASIKKLKGAINLKQSYEDKYE